MAERLIDVVKAHDGVMAVPLMGFPGIQLSDTSLRENTFNWVSQFSSLLALQTRFQPDGLFFFMDLSVEANALGLQVRFPRDESPSVEEHPIKSAADLDELTKGDITADGRAMVYIQTMRLMKRHLNTVCGGYVVGPFSLAGLLMGASEAAMATVMAPDDLYAVLRYCTEVIKKYVAALDAAGADTIAILEPTGGLLSPRDYIKFSGQYVAEIIAEMKALPILHICGQTTKLLPVMCETGAQGLSLDSMVNFPEVAKTVPSDVVLIGNLDPVAVMKQETPNGVYKAGVELIEAMKPYPNFIYSTGCDLPPDVPLANLDAFFAAARGTAPGQAYEGVYKTANTLAELYALEEIVRGR